MRELFIVDLDGSVFVRRLVQAVARRAIARAADRLPPAETVPVLLGGAAPVLSPGKWPMATTIIRPDEVLSPGDLAACEQRTHAAALELIRIGKGSLFPAIHGVDLGALNLTLIHEYFTKAYVLTRALDAVLDRGGVARCRILSGDGALAEALYRVASVRVEDSRHWSPIRAKRISNWIQSLSLGLLGMARRNTSLNDTSAARVDEARPRVAIISESRPMAQTFDVVEQHLLEMGVRPLLRIEYGGAVGVGERRAGVTVLAPGSARAHGGIGRLGPSGRQWRSVRRDLETRVGATRDAGPLGAPPLETLVGHLYLRVFGHQSAHLATADRLLERFRPDVLVVGNDRWWVGQAFVRLARLRGIPSLCVQDGMAGNHPEWWWMTADRVASSGNALVRQLRDHGVPADRCVVTGQPRYDRLHTLRSPEARVEARTRLELDPDAFCVLFAGQPHQTMDYVRDVCSAVCAVPGVRLLLRPHPSQDVRRGSVIAARDRDRVRLSADDDIFDLISACDVVVTQFSTVAFEAAVVDKPVIIANFGDLSTPIPVEVFAVGEAADSPAGLTAAVERIRSAPVAGAVSSAEAAHSLEELLGPMDGQAGRRTAQAIADMLEPTGQPAATRSQG